MAKKEYELAYEDWRNGMTYRELAKKYNRKESTVRQWRTRYWNDLGNKERMSKMPAAVKRMNSDTQLTEKQKLFCLYYLQSFNGTQSYMKAYNAKKTTSVREASKLLSKPHIKRNLEMLKHELHAEQYFTIKDIINGYAQQAFADITDYVDFGTEEIETDSGLRKVNYVRLKESDEVDGSLLNEIKQGREGVSVKLHDKQKAMEMLLKYLPDDVQANEKIVIVDEWGNTDDKGS